MSFAKCRSKKTREALVSKYEITPVIRSRLLPGQKREGCCGLIEDECYLFSFQARDNLQDNGFFYAGWHCAEHFLELLKKPAPPLFNPLKSSSSFGGRSSTGQQANSDMCALNREAYAAINLLTYAWGAPRAPLRELLAKIVGHPDKPLSRNEITHLNNIVGHDRRKNMQAIIQDIRKDHPKIRPFLFSEINKVLVALNKHSNF